MCNRPRKNENKSSEVGKERIEKVQDGQRTGEKRERVAGIVTDSTAAAGRPGMELLFSLQREVGVEGARGNKS